MLLFSPWLLAGRLCLFDCLPITTTSTPAQISPPPSTDYYAALKTRNLSQLWRTEKLAFYGSSTPDVFPEPLGFIGSDYQRFYLHYTNVHLNPARPYVYQVSGKTRVKTNVCVFAGTITVVKARLYKAPNAEHPQFREGELTCRVELAEDRSQPGSGTISGTMITYFYLDAKGQPRYNTLEPADGFSNNECVATWTSYATGQRKPCHWGDFHIPESGDLNFSVSEFMVNKKYVARGWQTYMAALEGNDDSPVTRQARAEEKRQWWK